MDHQDILKRVKEDGVKYISYQFVDINGVVKSVDAPIERLEIALDDGIWFDGSSVEGFSRIQESDMHLRIDPDSYAILPWSPEEMRRARFFCDIYTPDGKPFEGDPRGMLRKSLAALKKRGYIYNVGTEPEFFLFRRNDNGSTHPVPHDVGSYFDFSPNDEAVRVRTELMHALRSMGLEVEVGHHEVALGQHEIDFEFTNALRTADNVVTMKTTVKAIADRHGLVASFMPKPVFGINGSGMHCHQSLSDLNGNNCFHDADDPFRLSKLGRDFIAGQLNHARGMTAVLAPTVNSYKRLVPGYEAPVYIGWAQVNRSALIRIPFAPPGKDKAVRAELRCPDPSSNPYLAFLVMLAAGLDGIDHHYPLTEPLNDINVYEMDAAERASHNIISLPGSLMEAMADMEKDEIVCSALGSVMKDAFLRSRQHEWEAYRIAVTDWEIKRYLEMS
ncbi:MAG: glutamine synthetase [Anaerolineaceae bacterium]|nr:glutamine synthetase [Anaerolineaceae bacterium]MBN2678130.1 glutamine synthetase [Anaerolineaceae bacterium]